MGKVSKATKKFQSKHLKHTLDHRKEVQKHNKLKLKKKTSNGGASAQEEDSSKKDELFDDMTVEDFFASGFEVPVDAKAAKQNGTKKVKKTVEVEEDSEESSSEEEFEQDMSKLKDQDPEFYKYLEQNDKALLDFKPENPLDVMSDSDSDAEGDEVSKTGVDEEYDEEPELVKTEVTVKLVKTWNEQLSSKKPDLKTLKNVVMAFKAAVNIDSADDYKYTVTSEKAFSELMFLALKQLPKAVQTLVPYAKNKNDVRSVPSSKQAMKKVSSISSILKAHSSSLLHLLSDITNTETAALVLTSIQEILPYYLSQRKLIKKILEKIIVLWSSTKEVQTQIAAFAFLNNAAREFPKAVLETILKLTYSTFVKHSRATNVHTDSSINFQKNSAAELFGIDQGVSYQIGFEFIRQLAIHLRNSTNNPTKDSYKIIYNWQFCHSLDFWSRVLSKYCNVSVTIKNKNEAPLRDLIYPLVQVTIGTIRLLPSAQFYPLRFYLIRSLIRLSQNTDVFIPIFPLLSEILNSTAFTKHPKPANKSSQPLQAVDFEHNIKVNAAYLNTRIYQDGLCEQFIELVGEFFGIYSKSISYPELVTPPVILLKRYAKKSRNAKFNKQLSNLSEKLNSNAKFIIEKRSNVEFGPNNRAEVNKFLSDFEWKTTPLGKYLTIQREVKAEKAKLLKDSLLENEEERQKLKQGAANDDSDLEVAEGGSESSEEEESDDE